jgi:hypothetical protein
VIFSLVGWIHANHDLAAFARAQIDARWPEKAAA